MKTAKTKKVSLVKCAAYAIGLDLITLLVQICVIIKNIYPSVSSYIGPIYLSLLYAVLMLILLIMAGILLMKQYKNREKDDELSNLNNYKAGYIAKYICVVIFSVVVLLVKDFSLIFGEDVIGNVLVVFLMSISITDLIHNIIFIILEKK